jgi:stage V sporulation protein G
VLEVQLITAGRLIALAAIELEVDGIAIVLQGVRVVRTGPRTVGVAPPSYRGSTGAAVPAVMLPEELSEAIAGAVLDKYEAQRSALHHHNEKAAVHGGSCQRPIRSQYYRSLAGD